ncbi:hypothetical protein [Chitinophaga alhagiae]|uniref:hypothetical protein n=1 Tax=Chitinophaga alhagiae TaxID=2203219 RepID=UPI000E5C500B|nr:hypothetical protein [Chitinophaga alhagiae]
MKPYLIVSPLLRPIWLVALLLLSLLACQKSDTPTENIRPGHTFTNLPDSADSRLSSYTDSLLVSEAAKPWMDSVTNAVGKPNWKLAAFGVQGTTPSVMVPLINYEARQVTGLLVMLMGEQFRFRIFDSRKPERYGFNNGRNRANARTVFIAADLFNQKAFPDKGPAAIGPCLMTRKEKEHFDNARKTGGSFTPMVKAAGYAMSITCYTTMACTGDGFGNCVGNIVYHTDCVYNYIWVDDGSWGSSGGNGGIEGEGAGGGGGGGTPHAGPPDPSELCGVPTPVNQGPVAVLPPSKPIENVKQYISCFDARSGARITFYADQPAPGSDEPFAVKGKVGHSYITIEQFTGGQVVRRTLGFHPYQAVSPFFTKEGKSQLGDDSGKPYDVRLDVDIDGEKLNKVLLMIEQYNPHYHLETYNCTNFALDISDACGIKIPRTKGWWLVGSGLNPGNFGYDLAKLRGAIVGQGQSDDNEGDCNK